MITSFSRQIHHRNSKGTVNMPQQSKNHEELARQYYQQRKWDLALDENQKALEENPNSDSMLFLRTHLFLEAKNYLLAEEIITQIINKIGETPETLNLLGVLQIQKGQVNEAIATLEKAIVLDQHFWKTHFNLGNIHFTQKQYQSAVNEHWKALKYHRSWQTVSVFLGSVSSLHPKLFRLALLVSVLMPFITKSIVGMLFSSFTVLFFLISGIALWNFGKKKEGIVGLLFSFFLIALYIFYYRRG